jgi:hypothetical protein
MYSPQISDDDLLSLVDAGIQAPSADNRHVVRFEFLAGALRLWADAPSIADSPRHRVAFAEFSFGAVIENIVITASRLGIACALTPNANWQADHLIGTLTLSRTQGAAIVDPLSEAISHRHTNRRLYDRERVNRDVLDALNSVISTFRSVNLVWLESHCLRRQALHLIRLAETERFRQRELHAELFRSIRFDVGWNATVNEGLPPGSLEIAPALRRPFQGLSNWRLQRILNVGGAATVLGVRAGWLPAWTASHLGLVTVERGNTLPWLSAGRAFQRVWLGATLRGLAMQPMAAPVALAMQEPNPGWVSRRVQIELDRGLNQLASGKMAALMFRLGHSASPSVIAGRRAANVYRLAGSPPKEAQPPSGLGSHDNNLQRLRPS